MKWVLWIAVIALLGPAANAWQSRQSDCQRVLVPAGTEIPLVLAQDINPRTAKAGDLIDLTLVDDFHVAGCIVAAKGTTREATISSLARPRSFGRQGKVELRFESLPAIDGQNLWFDPSGNRKDGPTNSARGIGLPEAPLRFTLHGSHAVMPRGTLVSLTVVRSVEIRGRPVADPPGASTADLATVVIFQSPQETAPGQEQLFSGGVFLSCFERGRYFKGELGAGNYRLGKSKVQLQLNLGTVRYFRIYNEEAGALEEASVGEFEFFAPELQPLGEKCSQNILQHAFRPIRAKH